MGPNFTAMFCWNEYTIGQAQNQAVRMTSMRCWVSRRYTLIDESSTASAPASTMPANRARKSSGRYVQSGELCRTTRKMTITQDWKKKKTQAEPTAARARISRGNDTFLTMPGVVDDHAGPGQHAELEEVPDQQAGEEEDDEVGHAVAQRRPGTR